MKRSGSMLFIVLILLIMAFGIVMSGGSKAVQTQPNYTQITPLPEGAEIGKYAGGTNPANPSGGDNNLQLQELGYITATPAPTATPTPVKHLSCPPTDDNGIEVDANCPCVDASVVCKNGQPFDDVGNALTGSIGTPPLSVDHVCGSRVAPHDGRFCVAKPVIYLYPTTATFVSVRVISTGNIVQSDPLYPVTGWQNILAFPNGNLIYETHTYHELFYETSVKTFTKPTKGIIIKRNLLQSELDRILDSLGLMGSEKTEFLTFWVPKLQAFQSPYIFFSLIDPTEKEKIDTVVINPEPTTRIEFLAYFKPITDPAQYDGTLTLPPTPIRKGFVAVEWGGSVDTNEWTIK